jgi:hypothetical protein
MFRSLTIGALALGVTATYAAPAIHAEEKPSYPALVEQWGPPFDMNSPREDVQYVPLEKAS